LALPHDTIASNDRDFSGKIETGHLGHDVVARLKAIAERHGTTPSTVVLALFELVLYQWTRQTDFCVGLAMANRNRAELENLIGFFVNVLPIRAQLSSEMEFSELVDQVAARTREAFEHQDYPFDLLVQRLNPDRAGTRQPILNVIFAFQNFEDVAIDIGAPRANGAAAATAAGALVRPFALPFETAKFDMTLFVTEIDDGLRLSLEYDTRLFRRETIRRVIGAMERFAGMVG
jgi:non-ribosomal peptide synthetase component F